MKDTFLLKALGEYDFRGVYGLSLTEEDAYALGERFPSFCNPQQIQPKICVARDGRLSSPSLMKALIEGLIKAGAHVLELGVGPTPMLYHSVKHYQADGGIMVTGSHNPSNENGFKMLLNDRPFWGEDLKKLISSDPHQSHQKGTIIHKDFLSTYINYLYTVFQPPSKAFKVAWDPGNGATGKTVEELTKLIPGEHIVINSIIDGNFPAHHPDPSVYENMKQLIHTVQTQKCDLGLAFDGDGDRMGVVDAKGRMLWSDQFGILLAKDVLSKNPGTLIIGDIKSSQLFFAKIEKSGGTPLMVRTGHAPIKMKLKETGAQLAVEFSGHIFYKENYGFDDGLYAAIKLLNILQKSDLKLEEFIDHLPPTYTTPEIKIPCEAHLKNTLVTQLTDIVKSHGLPLCTVDGVRVQSKEGWWLVRASNTQPFLVVRCEADTSINLTKIINELNKFLLQLNIQSISVDS